MRKQLDIFDDDPARQAIAARKAAETARIDPNFYGAVRQARVQHYLDEAERLEQLASMSSRSLQSN